MRHMRDHRGAAAGASEVVARAAQVLVLAAPESEGTSANAPVSSRCLEARARTSLARTSRCSSSANLPMSGAISFHII